MTNPQSTPEAVVWVAIDVAKDRHEALIEAPGWKSRKKFRVQNTAEEFRALAEFLHGLALPVWIGFEPTGNYHRALVYFLHSEGFHLELIPSVALARTREAMHNSWDKNDPKDAQVILYLLKGRLTQHFHDPMNDLQELSKTHHYVSLENPHSASSVDPLPATLFLRRSHAITLLHARNGCVELTHQSFRRFFCRSSITQFSKDEFVRKAWKVAGRKVAKERIFGLTFISPRSLPLAFPHRRKLRGRRHASFRIASTPYPVPIASHHRRKGRQSSFPATRTISGWRRILQGSVRSRP